MGPQGRIGPQGDDGAAATIALGTVHYVGPDEPPNVLNTGDDTNAVLDFYLPWFPASREDVPPLAADAGNAEIIETLNALIDALAQLGILQ